MIWCGASTGTILIGEHPFIGCAWTDRPTDFDAANPRLHYIQHDPIEGSLRDGQEPHVHGLQTELVSRENRHRSGARFCADAEQIP
jgi:hypothetical protein